jgi:hypothetical protein
MPLVPYHTNYFHNNSSPADLLKVSTLVLDGLKIVQKNKKK